MNSRPSVPSTYGMTAQFQTAESLVCACESLYLEGYRNFDTYSPFAIDELEHVPPFKKSTISRWTLVGGILGASTGFGMQWYANVISYPQNIAGRPLNSWPAFIPITFALTILCAALATVLGLFILNRLPAPYHPMFNSSELNLARADCFLVTIKARDAQFDHENLRDLLRQLGGINIHEVLA